MNYIKRLEQETATKSETVHDALMEIMDLVSYLNSKKFWVDTSVNTRDVLTRLQPAISKLREV